MSRSSSYAVLGSLAILVFSCASAPKQSDGILEARAKIQRVEQMPLAGEVAAQEIDKAHTALREAEALAAKKKPAGDIANAAYIAKRHAEIAEEMVAAAESKKSIENAERERQAVLLAAREEEARRNARAADAANRDAANATRDAANATRDAANATKDAAEQARLAELSRQEAEEAKRRLELLQKEMSDLNAKQTERGLVLTLGDVLFDTGKSTIKSGAMSTMDRLAKFMKETPEYTVLVEGHTDSMGTDEYNQGLSERRASAVRDALTNRGVDNKQINSVGKGEGTPVASNDDAGGRQQNRRVEIIIDNTKSGQRVTVDK